MLNIKICLLGTALAVSSTFARGADKPGEIPFRLVQGFGIVPHGPLAALDFLDPLQALAHRGPVVGLQGQVEEHELHAGIEPVARVVSKLSPIAAGFLGLAQALIRLGQSPQDNGLVVAGLLPEPLGLLFQLS